MGFRAANAVPWIYVLRWKVRGAITWNLPLLARLYFGLSRRRFPAYADSRTEVVIDGYPRSGNTFSYQLLRERVAEERMVHHVHSPAAIRSGVTWNKPTVLLIRAPLDAAISLVALHLRELEKIGVSLTDAQVRFILRHQYAYWCWYYEKCLPLREAVAIVPIDTLQKAPERLLQHLTDMTSKEKQRLLERTYEKAREIDHMLPRGERQVHADRIRRLLSAGKAVGDLDRGRGLYEQLTAHALSTARAGAASPGQGAA